MYNYLINKDKRLDIIMIKLDDKHSIGTKFDQVFEIFHNNFRRKDDIIRKTKDNTFICLVETVQREDVILLVNKIKQDIDNCILDIDFNIGIAHLRDDGDQKSLLARAKKALNESIEKGKNQIHIVY